MSESKKQVLDLFERIIDFIHYPAAILDIKSKDIIFNSSFNQNPFLKEFKLEIDKLLDINLVEYSKEIKINHHSFRFDFIDLKCDSQLYLLIIKSAESEDISIKLKNLSHDLNNILTTIYNSVLLLKNNSNASDKLINNIEVNVLRASSILDSTLNLRDKDFVKDIEIDISKLINELVDSLKYFCNKKIQFTLSINNESIWVLGNYDEIYRALQNILVNSIEAIKDIGKIEITIHVINKFVRIKISDNGPGIKKSVLKKIFEKNFSTKNKEKESGLGLYIAKNIIEKHSGYIEVYSVYRSGTEFRVFLPVYNYNAQKKDYDGKSKKILIADDEENILLILKELLTSYNYIVFTAKNGREVIEIVSKETGIENIIIDKKMPELDGLECIKILRANNFEGKIILTTGSPGIKLTEKKIKELGIYKVIVKPYDFNNLLEII